MTSEGGDEVADRAFAVGDVVLRERFADNSVDDVVHSLSKPPSEEAEVLAAAAKTKTPTTLPA